MSAKNFCDAVKNHEAIKLIDFELEYGDVLEIDDGFKPYFFYFKSNQTIIPVHFNPPIEDAPVKTTRKKDKDEH